MKILATVSDQAWGGKHQYMSGVLSGLAGRGHHVALLAEAGGRMAARHAAGGPLTLVPVPPFTTAPGDADAAVAEAVRASPPDIFIASGRRDLMAVYRARAGQGSRSPFVLFRHSAFPLDARESAPEVLGSLSQIIGTSREQLDRQFPCPATSGELPAVSVALLPSAVPEPSTADSAADDQVVVRRRLGVGLDSFVFLVLSRLSWEKGVDKVISAFAGLAEDAVLVIAGEGAERDTLEAAAGEAGGPGRVIFRGHVDDPAELIGMANAVVLGSTVPETGPLALKEAMAAGKAVIAPAIGGIPEFVEHGRTGLLYEAGSTGSLRAAMRQLFDEEDLGPALGRAAARAITEGHRLDRRVEHLDWLLSLLLIRHGPAPAALAALRWDEVRLRPEKRCTFLFVPRTSQITEVPPDAAEAIQRSWTEHDPGLLTLDGELTERLFQMGALVPAAAAARWAA